MREWLFISDLHLAPERPEIIHLFERFVDEVAIHAERLYILGDFLEYWLGDDDKAVGLEKVFQSPKINPRAAGQGHRVSPCRS